MPASTGHPASRTCQMASRMRAAGPWVGGEGASKVPSSPGILGSLVYKLRSVQG